MAYTDEPLAHTEKRSYPRMLDGGMWVVHIDSEQYRAWKYWLANAFGKRFFAEPVMQVWGEFPPITQEGADRVAQAISEVRNTLSDDPKFHHRCKPVPRHPAPWGGYIPLPTERERLIEREAMHEIARRLVPESTARKERPRKIADIIPISDALRNRLGIQPPQSPEHL